MDDNTTPESARQIDAAEANRLAQELDDGATGANLGVNEIPTENRQPGKTVNSTPAIIAEHSNQFVPTPEVFPPDIDGNATVGGDPESLAVLREEENS
jgi:hypothetical protein